jgi:PAS domain S-box-containing protein
MTADENRAGAGDGNRRPRPTSARSSVIGTARPHRRLEAVVGLFLVLIAAIVAYNARATGRQRDQALVVNVASRQRALAERYIKDVLLVLDGAQADPEADAALLEDTADALLNGGTVIAVQGGDSTIRIRPVSSDWRVIAKLKQERRLIDRLVTTGRGLARIGSQSPSYPGELQHLRVLGALVSTISNDAVGQMTLDAQSSLARVVRVGVGLGVLGALAAIAMGLLMRRAGQRQAAQFRALVHNSSDLINVVDARGVVLYESPASERLLGHPASEVVGSPLSALIHEDDAPAVLAALDRAMANPGSTERLVYRRRAADSSWRHMESVATSLLHEPLIRGVVVNSRDVTERMRTQDALAALQLERAKLLDRTVQATEKERKRLALELHDGPVQHLAALALKLERVGIALQRPGRADPAEIVEQIQARLGGEVADLRRMMSELRPPALDERGLEAALMDHLGAVQVQSGLQCTVHSTLDARLDPTNETVLYRVAQEALTNVAKHARAGQAWVNLRSANGQVELEIRDDGVGFDQGQIASMVREGHFGLIGMRERVEMAGGSWELISEPGTGTTVRARLPQTQGVQEDAEAPGRSSHGDIWPKNSYGDRAPDSPRREPGLQPLRGGHGPAQ